MFSALAWLLDVNQAPSTGSSSRSDDDDTTSCQEHDSSSSEGDSDVDGVPYPVRPITFNVAQGEPVAELHVNAADKAATAAASPLRYPRLDTTRRDSSLFADLHLQGSTYFTSAVEGREGVTYSAASPLTVPVWNLSSFTSDSVGNSPLPSPSYAQAPTNPSAAFYSLAERGAVVVAPSTGATAAANGGRTLWSSESGAVLLARFPAAAGNDCSARHKTWSNVAAPVMVEEPRRVAAVTLVVTPPPPPPSSEPPQSAEVCREVVVSATSTTSASETTSTATQEAPAPLLPLADVSQATPELRIPDWANDAEKEEEWESRGPLPPVVLTSDAGAVTPTLLSRVTGLASGVSERVVQLRPTNPFLLTPTPAATTLPSTAASDAFFAHAAAAAAEFCFGAPPPGTQHDASTAAVAVVSLTLAEGGAAVEDGGHDAFMQHALRQRTEELLRDEEGASALQPPSPQGSQTVAGAGVELGDGLVTLTAMDDSPQEQ